MRIEKPENSYAALEEMKAHVQGLLEKLGLPWHILRLCGGDMSFTSAITFDFEVWSGAQKRWLEVSSVSNFGTSQANTQWPFLPTMGMTSIDIRAYMNDIFRISNIKEERGLSYPFQRSCSMSLGLSF